MFRDERRQVDSRSMPSVGAFYRARYFNPSLQRFISEDPIGFNGGVNFYSYVRNSAVNFVDPSGRVARTLNPETNLGGPYAGCACGAFGLASSCLSCQDGLRSTSSSYRSTLNFDRSLQNT
jgi:RHS repeat-associated protein